MQYEEALREVESVWRGRKEGVACSTVLRRLAEIEVLPETLGIGAVRDMAVDLFDDAVLAAVIQFFVGHAVPLFAIRYFYPLGASIQQEISAGTVLDAERHGVFHDPATGEVVPDYPSKVEVRLGIRAEASVMIRERALATGSATRMDPHGEACSQR